jgi:hypothetical protein
VAMIVFAMDITTKENCEVLVHGSEFGDYNEVGFLH